MLASQLASSASSASEASSAYQARCETLTNENKKLAGNIAELEGKLETVAVALDAMAAEQERIVEAATKHEKTMMSCAKAHQAIIHDTTRQETLLEDAAKEREQIVSILMRQAEDAERTMAEREKVLEAVKKQEADIQMCEKERDSVVNSVNKQREYMDFMLHGELQFLKRTVSEDKMEMVNEKKMEDMEHLKSEYISQRTELPPPEKKVSPDLAAAIAEAMQASETSIAEEKEMDTTAVTTAVFGTAEKLDGEVSASPASTEEEVIEFSMSQYDKDVKQMKEEFSMSQYDNDVKEAKEEFSMSQYDKDVKETKEEISMSQYYKDVKETKEGFSMSQYDKDVKEMVEVAAAAEKMVDETAGMHKSVEEQETTVVDNQ